ncbi:MAG TPA: transcriptional regulator [Parvularcula sp.]|nr:transcriptional regulator [Parvularcula sp.]
MPYFNRRSTLTITAKGQVTLKKELLDKLGLAPGDQLDADITPERKLVLQPKGKGKISGVFGKLKRPGQRSISIEEMNEVIADSWAGKR